MDTPSRFPPLDPSTYEWTKSACRPGQWRRPALAGESLWIPRPKDYHEMFIGGSLALSSVVPPSALTLAAKFAWRRLRFEVPELVVSAVYGTEENAYMQYQVPSSEEEVNQWIERTTSFECGKQSLAFQELLENIREKKAGHDSDQVFLFLHPVVKDKGDRVKRVDFLLNADHQITDGIGIRILLDQFLALLAESLSSHLAATEELNWQQSVTNLTSPWIGLMNEEQLLSGPDYDRAVAANEDILFQKMPQNPGLPLLSTPQKPIQKTHFINLTETQSTQLLKTIKRVVSADSNITHLGHAAMVLALLQSNPPSVHSQTLHSPCWLNGRRYLNPFTDHPTPTKSYIPICQSFAPVIFSDLDKLVLSSCVSRDEIREMLVKACRVATADYRTIKERKSMLPECVVLFERLGKNMYLRQQQELLSGSENLLTPPAPPPRDLITSSDASHLLKVPIPPGNQEHCSSRTADPFFLSDGIIEQYIAHEYFDESMKKMFLVDDITFAANAEKNLIVRMSSWRGRITLSGEWKESDYDGAMGVKFLEKVVDIMLSIIE